MACAGVPVPAVQLREKCINPGIRWTKVKLFFLARCRAMATPQPGSRWTDRRPASAARASRVTPARRRYVTGVQSAFAGRRYEAKVQRPLSASSSRSRAQGVGTPLGGLRELDGSEWYGELDGSSSFMQSKVLEDHERENEESMLLGEDQALYSAQRPNLTVTRFDGLTSHSFVDVESAGLIGALPQNPRPFSTGFGATPASANPRAGWSLPFPTSRARFCANTVLCARTISDSARNWRRTRQGSPRRRSRGTLTPYAVSATLGRSCSI